MILERRLRKLPGVTKASVDFTTGRTQLECDRAVSRKDIAAMINKDGYKLVDDASTQEAVSRKDYAEIGALFLIFVAAYFLV